jgi:hypothetical protein
MGLKVRLPQSFSQISLRMLASTGDFNPERTKDSLMAVTRGVVLPFNSPSGKRSPSMCTTTPGWVSSLAG